MGRMHREMHAKRLRLIRLATAKRVSASKIGIVFIYVVFRVPITYLGLAPEQSAWATRFLKTQRKLTGKPARFHRKRNCKRDRKRKSVITGKGSIQRNIVCRISACPESIWAYQRNIKIILIFRRCNRESTIPGKLFSGRFWPLTM